MAVTIKSPREIELMREAGRILAKTHEELAKNLRRRIGADCFPECEMIAVFHGTDFLPFEIRQGVKPVYLCS